MRSIPRSTSTRPGTPTPTGPVSRAPTSRPSACEDPLGGVQTPSAPGRVDFRTWARIAPSAPSTTPCVLVPPMSRPTARACRARHRAHPASRNTSVTATTPGPDEPRVLILASPVSYAPGQPHSTTTAGGRTPRPTAGGRPPRAAGARRARGPSRVRRPGGRRAGAPTAGRRPWSGLEPPGRPPDSEVGGGLELTTSAPPRSGTVAVDDREEAAAASGRRASGARDRAAGDAARLQPGCGLSPAARRASRPTRPRRPTATRSSSTTGRACRPEAEQVAPAASASTAAAAMPRLPGRRPCPARR